MNGAMEISKKLSDLLTKNAFILFMLFLSLVSIGLVLYIFNKASTAIALIAIPVIILGALTYLSHSISKIYSSTNAAQDLIPDKDRAELVKLMDKTEDPKEALEIFKQFVSLYGFTGNITRLGLSGLPLLTAALTIFFTILAASIWFIGVWVHGAGALVQAGPLVQGTGALAEGRSASLQAPSDPHEVITALMDLAKLTLGAFIGSFVQRNISEPSSQKPTPAQVLPQE